MEKSINVWSIFSVCLQTGQRVMNRLVLILTVIWLFQRDCFLLFFWHFCSFIVVFHGGASIYWLYCYWSNFVEKKTFFLWSFWSISFYFQAWAPAIFILPQRKQTSIIVTFLLLSNEPLLLHFITTNFPPIRKLSLSKVIKFTKIFFSSLKNALKTLFCQKGTRILLPSPWRHSKMDSSAWADVG